MNIDFPHPLLEEAWNSGKYLEGSTEPWTQQLVVALARSIGATRILETGTFLGYTTLWLVTALKNVHLLLSIENDRSRAKEARQFLKGPLTGLWKTLSYAVVQADALHFLEETDKIFDFAFLDDDHTTAHVDREIELLKPKMKKGGLICVHDVVGPFGLSGVVTKHHGFNLDLPKLHVGGGLGIIQV